MPSTDYNGESPNSTSYTGPSTLDEFMVWKGTAPSNEWFLTEYNNQNSPNTFYSVGEQETEQNNGGAFFQFI